MKILFVWLLTTAIAHADGISLLGMCHKDFDCKQIRSIWNGISTIKTGWLETTFGIDCPCITKLLKSTKPKIVRVHLLNGPCLRNKRCGRYEPFWKMTIASANRKVKKGDRRFYKKFSVVLDRVKKRLASATGQLTCYISPCLECNLYAGTRRILFDLVRVTLPDCVLVDSPISGPCLSGTVCERHGIDPHVVKPCIVDMDGSSGLNADTKKYLSAYRRCDVRYYWEPWMNCASHNFIDPRQRKCSIDINKIKRAREYLCHSSLRQSSDICLH